MNTEQVRTDIAALKTSYERNKPQLLDALRAQGLPDSWLQGWEAKLTRLLDRLQTDSAFAQTHVRVAQERNEFVTLEDGYVYWWPTLQAVQHPGGGTTGGGGALSAHELRAIADELDRRNAAWDAQIQNDPQIAG